MKNNVLTFAPKSNNLGSYRKEKAGLHRQFTLLSLEEGSMGSQFAIVRVYWPREQAYCCVWLHTRDAYAIGKGKAGGYGYCKESAAVDEALRSAGVQLEHCIHGVGINAVREALHAWARFVGLTNWLITEAHA